MPNTDSRTASIGPEMMEQVTGDLGVTFYTTLLALLQSSVRMFVMHIMEAKQTLSGFGRSRSGPSAPKRETPPNPASKWSYST